MARCPTAVGHVQSDAVELLDLSFPRRTRSRINARMPSASDLDFWLGTWNVRWGPAETDRGRNVITRTFGGYVVEERFDGRPGMELQGMSVSVFDEHRGLWRQTWVDDSGTYFALEGGVDGDAFVLVGRDHNAAEEHAVFRMRFLRYRPRLAHVVLGALARRGGDLRGALAHRLRARLGVSRAGRPRRSRSEETRRWLLQ